MCLCVEESVDNFVVGSSAVHRQRSRPDLCLGEERVENAELVMAGIAAGSREVEADLTDPRGLGQLTEEPVDLADRSRSDMQWVKAECDVDAGPATQPGAKQPVMTRVLCYSDHSDAGHCCFLQDAQRFGERVDMTMSVPESQWCCHQA